MLNGGRGNYLIVSISVYFDSEASSALETPSNSASKIAARSSLSDDACDCCDCDSIRSMISSNDVSVA